MSDPSDPDATGAYHPAPPTAPADGAAPAALLAGRYRIVGRWAEAGWARSTAP